MARATHRLTARGVAALKEPRLHADGNGLYLHVSASGAKSWRFIYRFSGKRCELGLGAISKTTLAEARDAAAKARALVKEGIDPKAARQRKAAVVDASFGAVATALIDGIEAGWRNPKHRQQWRNTLETYAAPIWDKDVAQIVADDLLEILRPIWQTKPETASRVRGRIERVLDAAKVRGLRSGENPASWRGNLSLLLPARSGKAPDRHHAAMPYNAVPALLVRLSDRAAVAARALEFTILTAARTSETLQATWSEIDLEAELWTIPATRMKAGKEHRVPLSAAALRVLRHMKAAAELLPADYIFHGADSRHPLSNMSMAMLLRRLDVHDVTVHGFRSSFRDWAGEETDYPREVAEAALAHAVGSEVERAYRRGDALAKRREMMEAWARYLGAPV